ncbi:hypothetical protein [Nonomuraea fuscirosea]|uniref:hypothetical protein n=1 Tax=Nonomuraea fuscirosea TaxID=1291556 RepID=UPI0033CF0D14
MTDFPFYRSLCDRENTGFRRLGLLAEAQYAAAIQDTRTVLVPVEDQMVPALCPIEYATGYDARRTRELTAQEDAFLLSLPPAYLRGQRKGTLPTQYAVLVENDHRDTDHLKKELTEHFPGAVTCDFPDPRARGSTASLTAYSATLHRNPTPRAPAEATATILNATSLRTDPHLTDQLWALYGERFDWLGKHHPLSMEESQSTFNAALFHRDTQTLVTFEQGRPVCIGLFMSSLAACDWLSPAFRASLEEQTAAANENLIYFYGLASSTKASATHAEVVMATFAQTLWRAEKPCRLIFETTNLSSRYIPRLVGKWVHGSGYGTIAPGTSVEALAQVDFWYLKATF